MPRGGIRLKKFIVGWLVLLVLVGCGTPKDHVNNKEAATIEGYVTATQESRFLVVSNEPVPSNDSNTQFVDALWVTTTKTLEIGDYVKVWADTIDESYPGQTNTEKIEVLPSTVKSTLSPKDIIIHVAKKLEHNPIITNINYDPKKKEWILNYFPRTQGTDQLVKLTIQDQQPIE
ncbi:DUF3221 domain-containing protein [Lysinibacillus sp. OL1]|nr:DUF3221 domain-containing protein [Lysinibacillus sp. OL1]